MEAEEDSRPDRQDGWSERRQEHAARQRGMRAIFSISPCSFLLCCSLILSQSPLSLSSSPLSVSRLFSPLPPPSFSLPLFLLLSPSPRVHAVRAHTALRVLPARHINSAVGIRCVAGHVGGGQATGLNQLRGGGRGEKTAYERGTKRDGWREEE